MTVLYWIQSSKPWKQYDSHRVNEIHQLTNRNCWRHCPGVLNPAELLSCGITVKHLTSSSMWWNDPAVLRLEEENWPLTDKYPNMDEALLSELMKSSVATSHTLANSSNMVNNSPRLEQIIDIKQISTLKSLLDTTAYILRFVSRARRHDSVLIQSNGCQSSAQLNGAEIHNAEMSWIRFIQAVKFLPEIQFLETAKLPQPIRVWQFRSKIHNNYILRCFEVSRKMRKFISFTQLQ